MSDEENQDSSSPPCERHYMRLSNLPWSANQQDIQKFFKDIEIPDGGISIHKKDVFIAFLSNDDLTEALKRNGYSLHGAKIYLSSLERYDFYKLRHRSVRRILNFSRKKLKGGFALRRIRPTFKASDSKDMFSVFNPEENELSCNKRNFKEETTTKRKIKPTQIDNISEFTSSHFDDRYSFETSHFSKKIKLDEKIFDLLPMCKT